MMNHSSELSSSQTKLLATAQNAASNSHSPYSNFSVGAALQWVEGGQSCGTNVENVSYGLTICAERSAVVAGIGDGMKTIQAVAVWVDREQLVSPCGACLQVIAEFAAKDCVIILGGIRQQPLLKRLSDFLPDPFQAKL
jgi:homotetrameric cytidine deaminase